VHRVSAGCRPAVQDEWCLLVQHVSAGCTPAVLVGMSKE
jgi:hypothetical protein